MLSVCWPQRLSGGSCSALLQKRVLHPAQRAEDVLGVGVAEAELLGDVDWETTLACGTEVLPQIWLLHSALLTLEALETEWNFKKGNERERLLREAEGAAARDGDGATETQLPVMRVVLSMVAAISKHKGLRGGRAGRRVLRLPAGSARRRG